MLSTPDIKLHEKLVVVETYWSYALDQELTTKPTIQDLYSFLESGIRAMLLLKAEEPGDPLHTEFFTELNQALEKSDLRALLQSHPLKDASLSDWFETLGRAGMWSPPTFDGNHFDQIPEALFTDLINTEPLNLLYRVRDYLPVAQAGTSWFLDTYSDVLQLDHEIRSHSNVPLSDPLGLLDKAVTIERKQVKDIRCKLPRTTRSHASSAPSTGPTGSRPTQLNQPTHMDPVEAPATPKSGDLQTVRYRFEKALRPQFWFIMLWAIAAYRENPKYLDPRDPDYEDKRNKIISLLHEILSDPYLQQSAQSFSYLGKYLPAYRTHCFQDTNLTSLNATLNKIKDDEGIPPLYPWLNRADPTLYTDPIIQHTLVNYWATAERLFGKYLNPPPKFPGVRDTKPNHNPPPNQPTSSTHQSRSALANQPSAPQAATTPPTSKPAFRSSARPYPPSNPSPNPPATLPPNPALNPNPSPAPPTDPSLGANPQLRPTLPPTTPTTQLPTQDVPMEQAAPLNTAVPIAPTQFFTPNSPFSPIQWGDLVLPYTIANLVVPPTTVVPIQAGQVARTVNPPSTSYPPFRPTWLHEIHRFDYTHNLVIVTRETNATDNGDMISVTQLIPLELYYSTYRPDPVALVTRVTVQPPNARPYLPP